MSNASPAAFRADTALVIELDHTRDGGEIPIQTGGGGAVSGLWSDVMRTL